MNPPNLPNQMENKTNTNALQPLSGSPCTDGALRCMTKTNGKWVLKAADAGIGMMAGRRPALPGMVHLPALMLS